VVAVFLLAGIISTAKADVSFKELLAEKLAIVMGDKLSASLGLGEEILGGQVHNTFETFDEGIGVDGVMIIDEEGFPVSDAGTVTEGYISVALSATTSATVINPKDGTIWVSPESYVDIITGTTTRIAYYVGTTTASLTLSKDSACGATGVCGAATAREASIINPTTTGLGWNPTTAGDVFIAQDFPGTDTRDGSGNRYWVPVKDDEYISIYASTTATNNYGTDQTQAATAKIKYKYFE